MTDLAEFLHCIDFRFRKLSLWILAPPPIGWRLCASVLTSLNVPFFISIKTTPPLTHRGVGRIVFMAIGSLAPARKGECLERDGGYFCSFFFFSFFFFSQKNTPWEGKIKVAMSPLGKSSRQETGLGQGMCGWRRRIHSPKHRSPRDLSEEADPCPLCHLCAVFGSTSPQKGSFHLSWGQLFLKGVAFFFF